MTRMRWGVVTAVAALAAVGVYAGSVKLVEDDPPMRPPKAGDVTGRIRPAKDISDIWAVNRFTKKTYTRESFDKATGKFTFKNLPGDAAYDICVSLPEGRRVEGIDLSFTDARMVRLAAERRKQLGLAPERTHAFSQDDVDQMVKWLGGIKDFTDFRRALYVKGHGRRATMLLEGMRTRAHHDSQGRHVWRIELWYFENRFGGWEKLNNQEQVLRRERILPEQWRQIHVEYYPELSARVDENGFAKPVDFEIPAKPDSSRGRIPGTAPEIKTKTHVLGIDKKDDGGKDLDL
jgi:hypothetical protein